MSVVKVSITAVVLIFIFGFTTNNNSALIEDLKLNNSDLPEGYEFSEQLNCKAIQAKLLYEKPEIYLALIGKIKNKSYQSFSSRWDKGSILYLEFEKEFDHTGFLDGLLWGGKNPSRAHPEEYVIKGNVLIIWSTSKKSPVKSVSKNKIQSV